MQENSSKLIVTLPVYKDVEFLEKTTQALEELTPTLSSDFVLLIAEDGSNSSQVVDSLKGRYANIVYIQNDRRLGRGRALREAWNKVQGDIYLYVDVDQATDLTSFDAYKNLVDRQREYALVTGSRYIPGAKTTRPRLRRTASIFYNWSVRFLFHTGVHDPRHPRARLARTNHLRGCASAQQEAKGIYHDGFAAARLARQQVQPRMEAHADPFDHRIVLNHQLQEHRGNYTRARVFLRGAGVFFRRGGVGDVNARL